MEVDGLRHVRHLLVTRYAGDPECKKVLAIVDGELAVREDKKQK